MREENVMEFLNLDAFELENILKLIIAAFVGGIIGTEREIKNRAAGFRTHILVTVGACLIMIISSDAFPHVEADPTRIAAQVVSGIGFLGAGSIMQNKKKVKGLTTAANIWVCGALGLAIGAGMYAEAITATIIIMLVLTILSRFAHRFFHTVNKEIIVDKEVIEELKNTEDKEKP